MGWTPCSNCALAELEISGDLLNGGKYRCKAGCENVDPLCPRFEPDPLNQDFEA